MPHTRKQPEIAENVRFHGVSGEKVLAVVVVVIRWTVLVGVEMVV
jgi:hypothetical protein